MAFHLNLPSEGNSSLLLYLLIYSRASSMILLTTEIDKLKVCIGKEMGLSNVLSTSMYGSFALQYNVSLVFMRLLSCEGAE